MSRRSGPKRSPPNRALLALRTVIRNDGTAYNYSLLATGMFGLLSHLDGPVSTSRVFVFVTSAALAFTAVEAVGSRGFRDRSRPDRGDVVVLGTAFGVVAISAGLAAGWAAAASVDGAWAWALAPFVASVVYVVLSAANMAMARYAEERRDRS